MSQDIEQELTPVTPVATPIVNAQIEITIDGEVIPPVQYIQVTKKCCIPCEFICVLCIGFSFLLLGMYIFLGRFMMFRNA